MNFGFSYVGMIFLLMLFIPNFFWTKNKPIDYDKIVGNENKVLLALERIGEVLVSTVVLIFNDFNFRTFTSWSLWLVGAIILMILYELYWIKYFKSKRTLNDFYSSYLFVPVAGASLPVLAFIMLGVYGENIILIISTIILGIGHIGIHLNHRKEIV